MRKRSCGCLTLKWIINKRTWDIDQWKLTTSLISWWTLGLNRICEPVKWQYNTGSITVKMYQNFNHVEFWFVICNRIEKTETETVLVAHLSYKLNGARRSRSPSPPSSGGRDLYGQISLISDSCFTSQFLTVVYPKHLFEKKTKIFENTEKRPKAGRDFRI